MFQGLTWSFNLFRALDQPKLDLGEVEKGMLQVLACHFELIYGLLPFQNASLLRSIKRYFNGPHGTYNQFSAPGQDENATCVKSLKPLF